MVLLRHVLPVLLQHFHALRHCAFALVAQFRIPPDIRKLHASLLEALYESNPLNVTLRVKSNETYIQKNCA